MMYPITILLVLAVFVSSCSSTPYKRDGVKNLTFTAPSLESTLFTDHSMELMIYARDNERSELDRNCSAKYLGSVTLDEDEKSVAVSIPYNEPTFLKMFFHEDAVGSDFTRSFMFYVIPKEGYVYKLIYDYDDDFYSYNIKESNLATGATVDADYYEWGGVVHSMDNKLSGCRVYVD